MSTAALVPWDAAEPATLSLKAKPPEIARHAIQLSERDRMSLAQAFESGAYAMAVSFVWAKGLAVLKKQLAGLGMVFVGEMLGRTDLDESSNPITDIREDEAIGLAEQLGMISTTEAVRLRVGQSYVNHFLDPDTPQSEELSEEEAIIIVRSCVASFLAVPASKYQTRFIDLRNQLESETLVDGGPEAQRLEASPYFFVRTTLTVLLGLLKSAAAAKLEHAAGNINALLPTMWRKLRERDKWQVGETYAIVQASNRPVASTGMRRGLMKVKGFDYVPETLRSDTFREAARKVLSAHWGFDNFHNEQRPMATLLKLGTSIPGPAVADCFTAALAVRLGNRYGHSWAAESDATKFLETFRANQWEYYLNKVLPTDRTILEKLAYEDKPLDRWQELVKEFDLGQYANDARAVKLVVPERVLSARVKRAAETLREKVMKDV